MSVRRELLKPFLSQYRRQFSVLDLGCGDGAVAKWIEQAFTNASVFTIDRESPAAMMKFDMTPGALERLDKREHFDVVLALNFLHHFCDRDWSRAVAAVARMGHSVLIQLPPIGDSRAAGASIMAELHACVEHADGVKIGDAWYAPFEHQRPIWLVKNAKAKLVECRTPWSVTANEAAVVKTRLGFTKPWIPGMSLWNMIGLGADRQWAKTLVEHFSLPEREHGDIQPWNFVYDGEHLHLIDPQYEPGGHWAVPDEVGLKTTVQLIQEEPNNEWVTTQDGVK